MEKQFDKVLLDDGWEKVPHGECSFVNRAEGLFLFVMWKILMKELIQENQHLSLTTFIWVALNECEMSKDIVDNYGNMFESRISVGVDEKLPDSSAPEKPAANTISSWSHDMEGHAKKCVARCCELANKTTKQLSKVATPCIDHQLKEEEMGSVGEKRLAQLISYIHHTSEFQQSCYVRNTAQPCRLALFQDSDFAGDPEDSTSTSVGFLCIFGSHTCA